MARLPVSLSVLEAIVAVADCGSFSEAAEVLSISQSAVSARIRSAEEILGVELFRRTTRKVVITPHGKRLKIRADNALAELNAVFEEFRDEERLIRGRVGVGATPSLSAILLPDIVRDFRESHPGIHITIYDDFYGQALERVAVGEVDFALTPVNAGIEIPNIAFEPLYSEETVLMTSSGHPLTRETPLTLAAISRYPLVSMPSHSAIFEQIRRAFAAQGLPFNPQILVMHTLSTIAVIRAGLGVGFAPIGLLRFLDQGELEMLSIPDIGLARGIAIARAKDRNLSPAAMALIDVIKSRTG